MIQLNDAPPGPHPRNDHWRGWLAVGLIASLALAGASLPTRADTTPDTPAVAALSSSILPAAASEVATPAVATAMTRPEAGRPQMDQRQRRILMLLMMNSAGAVRPYGTLGH